MYAETALTRADPQSLNESSQKRNAHTYRLTHGRYSKDGPWIPGLGHPGSVDWDMTNAPGFDAEATPPQRNKDLIYFTIAYPSRYVNDASASFSRSQVKQLAHAEQDDR